MTDEPLSVKDVALDSAGEVVRGIVRTPGVLALIALNGIMVGGWIWLLVQVSAARSAETQRIIGILDDCVKPRQ